MKYKLLHICLLSMLLFFQGVVLYAQQVEDLELFSHDVRIEENDELGGFFSLCEKKK